MIFIASILEPYLTEERNVAWRPPLPCIILADDQKKAVEALQGRFWIRVPEIELKLCRQYPDWKEGDYYEVTLVPVPEGFLGAIPVFSLIANTKRPLRLHI
ncbi:hypothetical protein KW799_00280 [Candidatus Parcubacteria bacterium]|nr:hypothetical protein [Candidatus Parcubacteria bacterium]